MRKRFGSLVGGAVNKKSATTFVPWESNDFVPKDVKEGSVRSALMYLYNVSSDNFKNEGLPRIALKNQLYSVVGSRTKVDQEINRLRENFDIKMFKTSLGPEQYCVMFTDDYVEYIRSLYSDHTSKDVDRKAKGKPMPLCLTKFITEVVTSYSEVSIDRDYLIKRKKFKDTDITELIKIGVLTGKDVSSWWLAIPCAGKFMKIIRKGRQGTLQIIRRTKYKEINSQELLKRKKPLSVKLGFLYHIHDLIGADMVACVTSTTGLLLKAVDD